NADNSFFAVVTETQKTAFFSANSRKKCSASISQWSTTMRSLTLLVASSLLMFAAGCGDASTGSVGNPDPQANVAGGDTTPAATPAPSGSSSSEAPSGPVTPPANAQTGNVYFRIANFPPNAADA